MIISMPTTTRVQQRYDHRLHNLVQRTVDVTVATDLGVPRSTARGWLGTTPTVVIGLDVVDLTEPELRREILKLRRPVQKLTALPHLELALLRPPPSLASAESGAVCKNIVHFPARVVVTSTSNFIRLLTVLFRSRTCGARYSPCRPNDENSRGKVQNVCIHSSAKPQGHLWDPYIPDNQFLSIYGPSHTAKTIIAMD